MMTGIWRWQAEVWLRWHAAYRPHLLRVPRISTCRRTK